jgi:hypothetical protein
MFPIDAAVMPFPNEETTPPVTKTYFDIQTSRAVLQSLPGKGGALNLWFEDMSGNRAVSAARRAAARMGLTDCIARSAAPTGLLTFPGMGFIERTPGSDWAGFRTKSQPG